jgi:hypothetical protein
VSSAKNSKDLAHFLNEKLDSDRNIRRRLWWKDIREHVVSVLLENAKGENQGLINRTVLDIRLNGPYVGMFLYVALMFEELHKKTQKEEVLKALAPENLPRKLPDLWARVLALLVEEAEYAGKDTVPLRTLLTFVTFAQDPLSLYELSWIIQTIAGITEYDVRREVEELCARYVEQYKHSKSPYLTHSQYIHVLDLVSWYDR